MKRIGFALIIALAVLSLLLAGCGGGNGDDEKATPTGTAKPGATATAKPGATATAKPGATATPKPTSKPSGDLSDIFGDMQALKSIKYDMIITSPSMPATTSTIWLKPETGMKVKSTIQGTTTIMIINYDDKVIYSYMPDENTAFKLPWTEQDTVVEEAEDIEQWNPEIIGSETIDGKKCIIVEYTDTSTNTSTKMWIWEDKSFPIRIEHTSPQGTSVIENKNIDFSNISDSEFKLPAGVEIQEMPF